MTRTFDAKSYTELLVRYQPKPIATEAEMDARDLEESDLIAILGSATAVSEILMNKRPINHAEARKLAEFFRVEMDLFLESE